MAADPDEPRPRLIHVPSGGEWEFVGEVFAGDVTQYALSAELWRNGDWVEAQVCLITEGRCWDPTKRGSFWHTAGGCAYHLRNFLQRLEGIDECSVLGPLVDAPADRLFNLIKGARYAEDDEWAAYATSLSIPTSDHARWKSKLESLEPLLRVLFYVDDIPWSYLLRTPHHDRLLFRDITTSQIHDLHLPPGETAATLRQFADDISTLLDSPRPT